MSEERYPYDPEKLNEVLSTSSSSPLSDSSGEGAEREKALALAAWLQETALERTTTQEKERFKGLARIAENPNDKATLIQMTDQVFRSKDPEREAAQLLNILGREGIPEYMSTMETVLFKIFETLGALVPGIAMPIIKEGIRWETAGLVLPAEKKPLLSYLRKAKELGLRVNLNFLGEAILGEREAERRFNDYVEALSWPEVETVSVKISTIFSQISTLARSHTVETLADRLETLYNVSVKERFITSDGRSLQKFVYLDMEEYSDMHLTADAFMKTLDRDGLEEVRAGIALQAYIPDSFDVQKRVTDWARKRVNSGKSPVTIRLVKGANMEMEKVVASTRGWSQAPYLSKVETDANFKRMLREGLKPKNIEAVNIGIASHNVFDISWAVLLAEKGNCLDKIQFEMLEGMANPLRRALGEVAPNILLYAPICKKESFIPAIGYLVRRLDENTGPENFLRHAFNMKVDTPEWTMHKRLFIDSLKLTMKLSPAPRRNQNRDIPPAKTSKKQPFKNEPDTDFSLSDNVLWAEKIIEKWKSRCGEKAPEIPLVIDGEERWRKRNLTKSFDPSRPGTVACRYQAADKISIADAVSSAVKNDEEWSGVPFSERCRILKKAALEIRRKRGNLIGASISDAGKTFKEADSEVSEAVDFVEFYSRSSEFFYTLKGVSATGKGAVCVVSPWNFPVAIPCGGIAAALSAGNPVILKPSSQSVLPAWILCNCFWKAGVSKKTLQFLPCEGILAHENLVGSKNIDAVIFTGSTETANSILKRWPHTRLIAETGGKNATLVTSLSDRDQAVKNVLHSAFSSSGQKCSATSLLILEQEVYEDPDFRNALTDAVQSLTVGSSWDLRTQVGPLISPPQGKLERALMELDAGECWLVVPENRNGNPQLYSPGIRWGVRPGSFTHMTELFGPVLSVIKAENLKNAVKIANQTGYGLTSGIESLDEREQRSWINGIKTGNIYVNRPTTGAIVLRQPFGGRGKSSIGPGIKAGGLNYVAQFIRFSDEATPAPRTINGRRLKRESLQSIFELIQEDPENAAIFSKAIQSYEAAYEIEFFGEHDEVQILGEDNVRKYSPVKNICIRVSPKDTVLDSLLRVAASLLAGCTVTLSISAETPKKIVVLLMQLSVEKLPGVVILVEDDLSLAGKVKEKQFDRIRYAGKSRVPDEVREVAMRLNIFIADRPIMKHGRLELIWYFTEQSISSVYHRYGNLGNRQKDIRSGQMSQE